MVHPSELLRTNSNEARTFSAPRAEYQLDCGITNLPILTRCCNLERLATPKIFLIFISLVGFLQGVTVTYFRETAKLWGNHYNIPPENIDWLIYTNEFFIGIFALVVAYYGNRIHRISWIGGLTIFQAIASAVLLVPEIYRENYKEQVKVPEPPLCNSTVSAQINTEINYIGLTVLAIYQIFFAMATVSFITHGMTYIDDNTPSKNSAGYIGIALAFRELGKQAGLYFSWIPIYTKINAIFVAPVWLSIVSVTFISGVLIAMFPKNMPWTLIRTLSASLVDLASGYTTTRREETVDGFFKTIFRLLRNKILMVNIFCAVFLQSGLVNFNIFEKYFNQASFQISRENDTSYIQFTTNILKQPLVAICFIVAGFLAAKTKPHLKSLVKWNITAIILIIVVFGGTAFLKCEPMTKDDALIEQRLNCNCSFGDFLPVCLNSKTYYSPCFAGCTKYTEDKYFTKTYNCHNGKAVEGPCNEKTCNLYYALSQVNRVFTAALLATTILTNLIINMRCILSRDKASALALEATFTALFTYLPVKAIYGVVAEHYCIAPKKRIGVCNLYSKNFATFLSICTICFMVLSLIFAIIVLILLKLFPIKEKDGDEDEEEEENPPVELARIHNTENNQLEMGRDEVDLVKGPGNSMSASLLEMENVGDDHDSIDSSSYLDDTRTNRSRVLESNL